MRFRRLTTEEFEKMTEEFTVFLASQGIDKDEWDQIKNEESEKAEGILDIFSDVIFEKALKSCRYLERISETEMHTYLFNADNAHMVSVRMTPGTGGNFLDGHMSDTFMDLLKHQKIEIWQGTKDFGENREDEMFEIIRGGAVMSRGELYRTLITLL